MNTIGGGSAHGRFNGPQGIAVDLHGDVYVADTGNNRIQEFSPTGRFMRPIGREGTGPGELIKPSGVAVDRQGNVYVADYHNNRIEKFSPTGKPLWATHGRHPGWG